MQAAPRRLGHGGHRLDSPTQDSSLRRAEQRWRQRHRLGSCIKSLLCAHLQGKRERVIPCGWPAASEPSWGPWTECLPHPVTELLSAALAGGPAQPSGLTNCPCVWVSVECESRVAPTEFGEEKGQEGVREALEVTEAPIKSTGWVL